MVLVLSAAFLHASWNALLRGGADRTQSMTIMNAALGIGGILVLPISGLPSAASAVYAVASGVLHWLYVALLVRTYRSGDLGETYPVARGSSPALVALGGSLFAGEWMNLLGTIGIGLVCAGIFMLAAARGRLHAMNLPSALATGLSIAAYTVVDGIGVRVSDNWLGYRGNIFALSCDPRLVRGAARRRWPRRADRRTDQGGQRRADFARGLWRHHLGDAGQRNGGGVGIARNQRGVRSTARSSVPQRAPDRLAHRCLLHHRRGCRLRRLAILIAQRKTPRRGPGRF